MGEDQDRIRTFGPQGVPCRGTALRHEGGTAGVRWACAGAGLVERGSSGAGEVVGVGALSEEAAGREPSSAERGGLGYRGTVACAAAGITYRQLDYWARTGLVAPTLRAGSGPGLYSFRDVVILKIVKRLLDAGVSLHNIRAAAGHLGTRAAAELTGITLMSDGAAIFECGSPAEVMELLEGGQGVFGISVGAVCVEVEEVLRQLPGEEPSPGEAEAPRAVLPPGVVDELAARRRFRAG